MDKLRLTPAKENKFLHNILLFLAPVLIVYISATIGIISANNGAVKLIDFIPNSFTWGAMTLYVLNSILDYLRKLKPLE